MHLMLLHRRINVKTFHGCFHAWIWNGGTHDEAAKSVIGYIG